MDADTLIGQTLDMLQGELRTAVADFNDASKRVTKYRAAVEALRGVQEGDEVVQVADTDSATVTEPATIVPMEVPRKTKDAILDVLGIEPLTTRQVLQAIESRGWLDPDIQRPMNAVSTALIRLAGDPKSPVEKLGKGYHRRDMLPSGGTFAQATLEAG